MNATEFDPQTDLKIERSVDLSPEQIWKAWTTPHLLMPWFCPKPWKVTDCRIDLRPGGEFYTLMEGPEGQKFGNSGCYLEIIPNKKLIWTDLLKPGFRPSNGGMQFTGEIHLEKTPQGTKYTAIVRHKDEASKKQHAEMGFEKGWGIALDQLVAHMKSL